MPGSFVGPIGTAATRRQRLVAVPMRRGDPIAAVLDRLTSGVMLFNGAGRLVYRNEAIERYGRDDLLPSDGSSHYLRIGSADLKEAIRAALAGANATVAPVLLQRGDGQPLIAALMPTASGHGSARDPSDIACVVFLSPASLPSSRAAALMGRAYRLTAAETRLLHLLLAGKTLDEAAGALAVKRGTVATHLKRTFTKVEVQRQSDLIRLAWQISPPAE